MNLDQLAINARLRGGWEALDLGFVMARQWYKPLLLLWLMPAIVFLAPLTFLFWSQPVILFLIAWWLKPFWERLPLYWASRAMFGDKLPLRAVLAQSGKLYWRDCLPWLLWRRLSPTRGFDLPVTVLENLVGSSRQKRLSTLHIRNTGAAMGALIACANFEMIVGFGLIMFAGLMLPDQMDISWQDLALLNDLSMLRPYYLVCFLAFALVAPFYTMACFALYLSRRIELEAWDIEIQLRQLDRRLKSAKRSAKSKSQMTSSLQIALFLLLGLFFSDVKTAVAEDMDSARSEYVLPAPVAPETSEKIIKEILQGEDFNRKVTVEGWRIKRAEKDESSSLIPEWLIRLIEWLENNQGALGSAVDFFGGVAGVLKFIVAVTVVSLLIWICWQYRDIVSGLSRFRKSTLATQDKPEVMFGLAVDAQSLPEKISDEVMKLWQSGEHRGALALLYRAALSRLIYQHNFQFHSGMTEGECLRDVEAQASAALANVHRGLTTAWVNVAYGHRLPATADVASLCSGFDRELNKMMLVEAKPTVGQAS